MANQMGTAVQLELSGSDIIGPSITTPTGPTSGTNRVSLEREGEVQGLRAGGTQGSLLLKPTPQLRPSPDSVDISYQWQHRQMLMQSYLMQQGQQHFIANHQREFTCSSSSSLAVTANKRASCAVNAARVSSLQMQTLQHDSPMVSAVGNACTNASASTGGPSLSVLPSEISGPMPSPRFAIRDISPKSRVIPVGSNIIIVVDMTSAELQSACSSITNTELQIVYHTDKSKDQYTIWRSANKGSVKFPYDTPFVLQFSLLPTMEIGFAYMRLKHGLSVTEPVKVKMVSPVPVVDNRALKKRPRKVLSTTEVSDKEGGWPSPSVMNPDWGLPRESRPTALQDRYFPSEVIWLSQAMHDAALESDKNSELLSSIITSVDRGKFSAVINGNCGFQSVDCVLSPFQRGEKQPHSRVLPGINAGNPSMLHAVTYKVWRDPNFELANWQSLRREPSCIFGYCGPEAGGWAHDRVFCVNPFHYINSAANHEAPVSKGTIFGSIKDHDLFSTGIDQDKPMRILGGHSSEVFQWLCDSHRHGALLGIDAMRARPDPQEVIKRLIEKVKIGTLAKKVGKTVVFEKEECVMVPALRESRSTVRMDIVNLAPKCWPHALAYRLWRDQYFQLKEWQCLRKTSQCKYGYSGPRSGGSGGWIDDNYICVNPFHYEVVECEEDHFSKRIAIARPSRAAISNHITVPVSVPNHSARALIKSLQETAASAGVVLKGTIAEEGVQLVTPETSVGDWLCVLFEGTALCEFRKRLPTIGDAASAHDPIATPRCEHRAHVFGAVGKEVSESCTAVALTKCRYFLLTGAKITILKRNHETFLNALLDCAHCQVSNTAPSIDEEVAADEVAATLVGMGCGEV